MQDGHAARSKALAQAGLAALEQLGRRIKVPQRDHYPSVCRNRTAVGRPKVILEGQRIARLASCQAFVRRRFARNDSRTLAPAQRRNEKDGSRRNRMCHAMKPGPAAPPGLPNPLKLIRRGRPQRNIAKNDRKSLGGQALTRVGTVGAAPAFRLRRFGRKRGKGNLRLILCDLREASCSSKSHASLGAKVARGMLKSCHVMAACALAGALTVNRHSIGTPDRRPKGTPLSDGIWW